VRLTNRDATTLALDAVTYVQPIQIDGVRPASGPTGGGISTTLHGRGFRPNMMVTFGGARASLRSVNNRGTRATVDVPAHTAGLVDVAASSASGGGDLARDAFYYRSAADGFHVASASPDEGPSGGGTRVTLVGTGLDRSGLQVRFGGARATILDKGAGWTVVETPSHATGSVDIEVRDGAGDRSVLKDAFVYRRELRIDSLQPASGPASGGTTVTIDGAGFQGTSEVRFGGVVASYRVLDDSTLEATAPSHAPGAYDVTVERGDLEATAKKAFVFEQSLEIFGFSPARGSVAGNTYVLVRGLGFTGSKLGATFDGTDATSLRRLDTQTLALRTPPRPAGNADVRVQRGGDSAAAPGPFRYFNPAARDGGTWGGSIEGSVNIAAYTQSQRPISGAFAMLSTNASSQYTAWTDGDGLATISGPDVYGPQTITVTARGYSSVTFQELDASNVTVFLDRVPVPSDSGDTGVTDTGTPTSDAGDVPDIDTSDTDASIDARTFDTGTPPSPPIDASYDAIQGPDRPPRPDKGRPIFRGMLTGLEKIAVVGPNEKTVATVYTTTSSIRSNNPSPGSGNQLESNGTYRIRTRTGDLALVAVGGVLNTKTQEFEPERLGVKRYQNAVRGKTYQRDIVLDIPLDESITFKISESPFDSGGPDIHSIRPFLDFGFEGVFGNLENARGTGSLVTADHYPELDGKLSDVTVATLGGSYTERSTGRLGLPQSVALDDGISSTGTVVPMPKLLGVPKITSPARGRTPSNGAISFRLTSRIEPDYYWIRAVQPRSRSVLWDMFAPGSARSIQLPNFPDLSDEPKSRRPVPYPSGRVSVRVTAIRNPNSRYEEFGYSDLSFFQWSAYGMSRHAMQF